MQEHVILVAIVVATPDDGTREDAEQHLHSVMPRPQSSSLDQQTFTVDSWWIAEDERYDGSDNDSAIFVSPGNQEVASRLLGAAGLTPDCNFVTRRGGQFGDPDPAVNPNLVEAIENLRKNGLVR